jgi:ubiquinone biosynthesis protein UbiJ
MLESALNRFSTGSVLAWYNRLLARESWARAALLPYAGRTARIDAGLLSVFLAVTPEGTLAAAAGEPTVRITLAPQAIAGSLWDAGAAMRDMRIEGDAAFAQALTDVLSRLRPDPAEDLSRIFGDAPAERIVGAASAALRQLRESAERIARQGADYLVAENPMIVGRQQWQPFVQELAELAARLELLEERIDSLSSSPPSPQPPRG